MLQAVRPKSGLTVVCPAAATQNLQAQFPVQTSYGLAEGFRIFLHQAGAVVKIFGAQRSRIGQQADDPSPNPEVQVAVRQEKYVQ
jgi:hypothetical protein